MVVTAPKIHQISESDDPKGAILNAVGDISEIEICADWVLLGTYIQSNKIGKIHLPDRVVGEDEFQGKIGLVLKLGPLAFKYEDYVGPNVQRHDWVVFWVGDAKAITINGTACRMVRDDHVRMRIADPRKLRVI